MSEERGSNVVLGTAAVVGAGAVLCIPFVGFGPLLIVLGGFYSAVIVARLLTK